LNFDILGLAETHLLCNEVIDLPGYIFLGNNKKSIHVNARKGSGGVAFLFREELSNIYNITTADDQNDGILWICFQEKLSNIKFYACVCYLPPINSSRQIDVQEFYDNLLCSVYTYQHEGLLYICDDFNGRIGHSDDYIVGVDTLPNKEIIDFISNT
jgi:exonuclease III